MKKSIIKKAAVSITAIAIAAGTAYYLLREEILYRVWQPIITEYQFTPVGNPFLDYKMTGKFMSPDGQAVNVPGYYDGDNKWMIKFTPDKEGVWTYTVSMQHGSGIAIDYPEVVQSLSGEISSSVTVNNGCVITGDLIMMPGSSLSISPGAVIFIKNSAKITSKGGSLNTANAKFVPYGQEVGFHGHISTFNVWPADGDGFREAGRIVVDGRYFKTVGNNKRWLKGGSDGPENFLAHPNREQMIDELSSLKANSLYILLNSIGGDGDDVWSFASYTDRIHYDTTKLKTWDVLFTLMQQKGIACCFVLAESEAANKLSLNAWQRKLYFREMAARFSYHPGLFWNLCEEYDQHQYPLSPTTIETWSQQLRSFDAYKHPIGVHNWQEDAFVPFYTSSYIDWFSVQYRGENYFDWITALKQHTTKPISLDETHHVSKEPMTGCIKYDWLWICSPEYIRDEVIKPAYAAGAAGVEIITEEILGTSSFMPYATVFGYLYDARN